MAPSTTANKRDPPATTTGDYDYRLSATQKRQRQAGGNGGRSMRPDADRQNNNNPLTTTNTYAFDTELKLDHPRRDSTLTLAMPSSILDHVQSPDLKSYLVGQLVRAMVVYRVDEVVVFRERSPANGSEAQQSLDYFTPSTARSIFDAHSFMIHLMEYLECPQYLRQRLFPVHPNLKFAGLLNPVDAPHHCRRYDRCVYREGVVVTSKDGRKPDEVPEGDAPVKGNVAGKRYIYCGLEPLTLVKPFPRNLEPGTRVTCRFSGRKERGHDVVELVSPTEPRQKGLYWGYKVRPADSLSKVFTECPYEGGYDLTIGTSERGRSVDEPGLLEGLPPFKHALLVFGGVHGLEACADGDDSLTAVTPTNVGDLFDYWVNTCPDQGSRTIRSEEAVLISLAALRSHLLSKGQAIITNDDQS